MLEDGLSYPVAGDDALGRVLVGGLLGFGSFLILPAFALFGYLVWVLASAARGESEPPSFEDWGEMLVDGLKATAVTLAYGVVPFGLVLVATFVFAGGAAVGDTTAGGVVAGVGVLVGLVALVATVLLYYLVPAALTNMALEDSFGAAFDADVLKTVLLSVDYLVAWLVPLVVALVVNVVVGVLAVTVVGLLLVPFVQFYAQVAIFYMFGAAVGEALDVPGADDGEAAPDVTPA